MKLCKEDGIIPISLAMTLRLGEVKQLAGYFAARLWQRQNLKPGLPDFTADALSSCLLM